MKTSPFTDYLLQTSPSDSEHPRCYQTAACAAPSDAMRRRADELLQTEIDFIANPAFRQPDAEAEILDHSAAQSQLDEPASSATSPPRDLPAHLARLCERPLLTAEEERILFRRMNYLKYRANVLRSQLDPDNLCTEDLERAEHLLSEAMIIRDQIAQANMRLVISVVKKFVTPQHSFDEMLSDGIMTMLYAIDKFDYDRGFRFSTYAYRSIARAAYRSVTDRQKENRRFLNTPDENFDVEDQGGTASMDQRTWETLRGLLKQMLKNLDQRERFIIRGRYALGTHRKIQTFQSLADKLGVSKERVRQLEQRAMTKLRTMAEELHQEELPEAIAG